jgi:NAD(P)H-hydrate epimerase
MALINPTGGAYLAMAGTGDVLTGMVAAFLAQGVAVPEAAALGAFLHGASADRLAAKKGTSGLLATEIAAELPECMQHLREQRGQDESIAIGSTLLRFPEP